MNPEIVVSIQKRSRCPILKRGSIGFHASPWSRAALYRASRCSRYLMKRSMTSTDRPRSWETSGSKYTTSEISLLGNRIHLSGLLQCFAFDLAWSVENGFRSKKSRQARVRPGVIFEFRHLRRALESHPSRRTFTANSLHESTAIEALGIVVTASCLPSIASPCRG